MNTEVPKTTKALFQNIMNRPTEISLNSTFRNASDSEMKCSPAFRVDLTFFAMLVAIVILYNSLVLWAIIKSRKKLKQNFVYCYVASLVTANIALGANTFITIMSYLIPFERPIDDFNNHWFNITNVHHVQIMNWFAFRKALTLGLFLVMSGSVMALTNGIIQSSFFVGRLASGSTKSNRMRQKDMSNTKNAKLQLSRRQTAAIAICLVWTIPFVYTLLTFVWNDCIQYCECLPAYYSKEHFCSTELGEDANKCSNVWVPLANMYILVAVIIWCIFVVAIFILLGKAIHKDKNARNPIDGFDLSRSRSSVMFHSNLNVYRPQNMSTNTNNNNNNNIHESEESGGHMQETSQKDNPDTSKAPLHPTIKLLISLSLSYTICTAPIMLCFLVDMSSTDRYAVNDVTITVASAIVICYTFISPSLLISYKPNLRRALIQLVLLMESYVRACIS